MCEEESGGVLKFIDRLLSEGVPDALSNQAIDGGTLYWGNAKLLVEIASILQTSLLFWASVFFTCEHVGRWLEYQTN